MKTFAREIVLVVEAVLFWMAALPFALLAWPVLPFAEKKRNFFLFNQLRAPKPGLTYRLAR
jgi:hypothetical protein